MRPRVETLAKAKEGLEKLHEPIDYGITVKKGKALSSSTSRLQQFPCPA